MRFFPVYLLVLVLVTRLDAAAKNATLSVAARATSLQSRATIKDYDAFRRTKIAWNDKILGSSASSHLIFSKNPPAKFGLNNKYFLGFGQPDWDYSCGSATNRKCRFLEHCQQPKYLNSLTSFLTDSCPIGNNYIGVCCETSTPSKIATTLTTARPKIACGSGIPFAYRIVGGRDASPNQWPWMVALFDSDGDFFCGGVLITNQHVLTATHCFTFNKGKGITARLGEYNLKMKSQSERDFKVAKVIQHESYNPLTAQNDIAILKLEQRVSFGTQFRHICLPNSTTAIAGLESVVAGWGKICNDCPQSNTLKELTVPIWNQTECVNAYGKRRIAINNRQLCAGFKQGGRDSCQGDSGGPLMVEASNRWQVVGIVSFGKGCAQPGFPGVYTRVSQYIDWIQLKVRNP